ncbi:MAG: hypothetical protein WD002_12820 [Pseudomonadales bacterium]
MNYQTLRKENREFGGTMGTSEINASTGFIPAFRDLTTGRVEHARFKDGQVAPVHLVEGSPDAGARFGGRRHPGHHRPGDLKPLSIS